MQKHDFIYTANFCEENIWQLGQRLITLGYTSQTLRVLMLSNAERHIALYQQQQQPSPGQPIIWDYHVLLLATDTQLIYDFDSRLPFPVSAERYFQETLMSTTQANWWVWIRAIPLVKYLAHFTSDRSHMLTSTTPPNIWPDYPPIMASAAPVTLMAYLDFEQSLEGCDVFRADHYE